MKTENAKQEKKISLSMLLDFYGDLLTEHQREIAEYSYNDDLSLSEIADITGITRQGVRASLSKTAEILVGFEDKLGLVEKFACTRFEIEKTLHLIERLSEENNLDLTVVSDSLEKLRRIYET